MRWLFPSVNFESAKRLAEALSLPPKTAQILIQRGLGDAQAAARFLQPELSARSARMSRSTSHIV